MDRTVARALALASILAGFVVLASLSPASASTAGEFLNAPVWYLQYEVTFHSESNITEDASGGKVTYSTRLERVFSASEKLNLRNAGPGTMTQLAMYSDGASSNAAMDMMKMMDSCANWMVGGISAEKDDPTEAELAAESTPRSPVRLDYERVEHGVNVVNEMGDHYDYDDRKTIKGSDVVLPGGFGVVSFEMNTDAKTFMLTLPYGYNSMGKVATTESVRVVRMKGAPPDETRETGTMSYDFPGIELDEAQRNGMLGGYVIRGTIDPASGKIAGEQAVTAHYTDTNRVTPGTLVFKYSLTMTPPRK